MSDTAVSDNSNQHQRENNPGDAPSKSLVCLARYIYIYPVHLCVYYIFHTR